MQQLRDKIDNIAYKLRNDVEKNLEDKLYDSEMYNLGMGSFIEESITAYLDKLITDEKVRVKFVKDVSKKVLDQHRLVERQRKIDRAMSMKLWKKTKGRIPCINECGHYREMSAKEIENSTGKYICAECSLKLEDDTSAIMKLFSKDIYKVCGIE